MRCMSFQSKSKYMSRTLNSAAVQSLVAWQFTYTMSPTYLTQHWNMDVFCCKEQIAWSNCSIGTYFHINTITAKLFGVFSLEFGYWFQEVMPVCGCIYIKTFHRFKFSAICSNPLQRPTPRLDVHGSPRKRTKITHGVVCWRGRLVVRSYAIRLYVWAPSLRV